MCQNFIYYIYLFYKQSIDLSFFFFLIAKIIFTLYIYFVLYKLNNKNELMSFVLLYVVLLVVRSIKDLEVVLNKNFKSL
ncbi:hypothetical protein GLOIN_2v1021481 [Rhizophagus irregularis DAOM 181602=DAOM 197198]|uniref:Uncharacterized protein n=1 Tax=Rhizophagus irregularis (strain DAOM 181602 / DAOM 197198 / MUCL 43194) TaxID=747089 RepID=A0A2P4QAS8_RHIID|nr:hypothetical protein GLOIN_2v1021481 [Rhizophagus irregularis DAOM 181602=DAOM 197198]POG74716.1 hypothetical protein GLOIN_2v1021481 [Rhizophagus irregularis DAOM 181602=DAOM 197198]GET61648.1 hypothetical protein GLOIN_2v1021481 [Rhizophagus irregularis DAOM 181602=DAOM 197198]|eukprot:XP_025181582.1 hypothetical protein GLOIN_2v1021481 [Rhizophagus irregularis DAOM 181602=DAOM 197198]